MFFFFRENNGCLLVYKKKKWLDCWFIWKYIGTPLIWSLMGQNKLAKLMDDCINEGFFTRKCMAVLPGSQKRGQIMKWPYCCITVVAIRRGFTVLHGLKAYGNNFSYIFLFLCLFVCLFLTEKVIAMSFPSSGKHKMYRNPISVSLLRM